MQAPAQGHTASSLGTPVRLASVLMFSRLCCSTPAAPTLTGKKEDTGDNRRCFSILGFCSFYVQHRTREGLELLSSSDWCLSASSLVDPPRYPRNTVFSADVSLLPFPLSYKLELLS